MSQSRHFREMVGGELGSLSRALVLVVLAYYHCVVVST